MEADKIIVSIAGLIGIILTYWFFFMKRDTEVVVSDAVDITVDGGYTPATIVVAKDKTINITFTRKDPSPCLEEVVLEGFSAEGGSASGGGIRKTLPLNQPVTIELTPTKAGEFVFSCGMNMFHGKIIVK